MNIAWATAKELMAILLHLKLLMPMVKIMKLMDQNRDSDQEKKSQYQKFLLAEDKRDKAREMVISGAGSHRNAVVKRRQKSVKNLKTRKSQREIMIETN
jgi:ABC-type transport system involved in cytochrome bd biosynthesis fused ATPase/permease subunit